MDIKLMENTKVGTFRKFNETVFKRNRKNYRIVQDDELTNAMLKSAGYSQVIEKQADVTEEKTYNTPESDNLLPDASTEPASDRPDFEGWDENQLREYTMSKEIPTHPAAKKAGLQAAITRYFDDLESQREGNRSE